MPAVCGVQLRQKIVQGASTRTAGPSVHLEYGLHQTALNCTWLIKLAGRAGCSLSHPRSAVASDVPLHRDMHSHLFQLVNFSADLKCSQHRSVRACTAAYWTWERVSLCTSKSGREAGLCRTATAWNKQNPPVTDEAISLDGAQ